MTEDWNVELNCLLNVDVVVEAFVAGGVTVAFEKSILIWRDLFWAAQESEPDLLLIDLGSNDSKKA